MKQTRRRVLQDHYVYLLKRFTVWAGLTAILATTLVALPANAAAGILGTRSSTLSNSAGAATGVTATFLVTPGTNILIKGVKFSLCTSPLLSVACTSPVGATLGSSSVTAGNELKNGTAIGANAYTFSSYTSTTDVCFTNATGTTFNGSSDTFTFPLANITLPTAVNTQFYLREQTFNSADCTTTPEDFGGFAEDTTQVLSVSANVQESLVFCTGTVNTTLCASQTYTPVALITSGSSTNPMASAATSYGTAYMDCSTNGQGGYAISYNATTFTASAGTIASAATTGSTVTAGTAQFGFTLGAMTSFGSLGAEGQAATPNLATSYSSGYNTNNTIAYNTGGSSALLTMTGANAAVPDEYTMTYGGDIATTTSAGAYTATQTMIATATF